MNIFRQLSVTEFRKRDREGYREGRLKVTVQEYIDQRRLGEERKRRISLNS
jgi:hypothetical protein